jgi:hypothetical protein
MILICEACLTLGLPPTVFGVRFHLAAREEVPPKVSSENRKALPRLLRLSSKHVTTSLEILAIYSSRKSGNRVTTSPIKGLFGCGQLCPKVFVFAMLVGMEWNEIWASQRVSVGGDWDIGAVCCRGGWDGGLVVGYLR